MRFTHGQRSHVLAARDGPLLAEMEEHTVEENESLDAQDQSGLVPGVDDARVVVDFAVGPPGVGPVVGFDSDDFFPSAPDADIDRNPTGLQGRRGH